MSYNVLAFVSPEEQSTRIDEDIDKVQALVEGVDRQLRLLKLEKDDPEAPQVMDFIKIKVRHGWRAQQRRRRVAAPPHAMPFAPVLFRPRWRSWSAPCRTGSASARFRRSRSGGCGCASGAPRGGRRWATRGHWRTCACPARATWQRR